MFLDIGKITHKSHSDANKAHICEKIWYNNKLKLHKNSFLIISVLKFSFAICLIRFPWFIYFILIFVLFTVYISMFDLTDSFELLRISYDKIIDRWRCKVENLIIDIVNFWFAFCNFQNIKKYTINIILG